MAFDPDEYLNETGTSSTATAEFDPDAYLKEEDEKEFDPDAYLAEESPLTGLEVPPAPEAPKFEARKPEEGILRKAADVPVRFLAGTTGVLKSFADVFGADSPASQQFEERQRFWNNLVSESGKEKDKRAAEIQKAAEDKGAWEQAKAAGRAFLESPTSMLATGAGSLAPFIATAGVGTVARGGAAVAKGAQLVAGTLAGAGEVKGRIYEEVKQAALDAGKTPEEAEAMASEAQSYGENPEQIIAGGALGALASVTGIEATAGRAIAGAARKAATGAQIVGKNVAQEVATEVPQQAQSAIAKNIALQKAGFDVPTFQGVVGEATTAGIVAAALGGVAGGIDAVAASSENAQKVKMAVNTQSAAQQVAEVAPLTASVVMDQAEETGRQAAADLQAEADQRITELTETPEQRVARLQREAQEAAGEIELEEEGAGLVDGGLVEVYKGQPVITQAGLEALPEAERPRLTPEARKIQIDTRTSEAAAEAISKNLRIGVDQVPVDVRMPEGWTLEGDIYVPPQPQEVGQEFTVYRGELPALEGGRQLAGIRDVGELMGVPDSATLAPFTYYSTSEQDARAYLERDAQILRDYQQRFGNEEGLKMFQSLHGFDPRTEGQMVSKKIRPRKVFDMTEMGTVADQFKMTELIAKEMGVTLPENWTWRDVPAEVQKEISDYGLDIVGDPDKKDPTWQYFRNTTERTRAALIARGLSQRTKEDVRGSLFAQWLRKNGYDAVAMMHETDQGPVKHLLVINEEAAKAQEGLAQPQAQSPTPEVREARMEPAITPQQDRDYLDAVERGDLDAASRVIDDLVRASGAVPVQGTRVYRGSVAVTGEAGGAGVGSTLGSGVYVTSNREAEDRLAALDYAGGKFTRGADGNIQEFLADLDNAFILDTDKRYDLEDLIADERLKPWFRNRLQSWLDNGWYSNGLTGGNIVALVQGPPKGHGKKADIGKAGFDAVVTFQDGEVYEAAVTNPEILKPVETVLTREGVPQRGVQGRLVQLPSGEIKSADPVTYDDQGNIIPLSQRFQPEQADIRYRKRVQMGRAGMEQAAVEARLQELGFPTGGIIRVVNEPDADFEGRTIILDGKVTGIELNAAALKDNAAIDRVLNHEFAESANADGALNKLVERLTPKEKKEINDTITRLRYEERARTTEEAARAIETLAEAWKGRGFFTRAVARVEAWASKLGFKLTRRAAEYIAARNLADINSGFRTAYNQTINRVSGDEARYSYAGTLAVTPRFMRDSLRAAQSMAAAGKTNEEIRLATGWFKGKYDNKLRWEIPDYKSFIKKDATKKLKEGGDVRLEDVLDHPELYAAYPDAKRIKVYLMTKDEGASYAANTIGINPFSKFEGFNFRNAMLHEIQHWIQDREGFASGTSPERFAHSMSRLKEDLKEAEEGLRDIKREWYDSDEQYQKERESWAWEVDLYKKIIRAKERGLGAYQIYQLAAGEIEANDVERRNSMDEEARKRYEPYAFSNVSPEDAIAMDVRGAMPTSMEIRESRREPEAIPTFTEGTPEAATLKEMAASMAKVDAASEAKGGKPETYKISEIASVWMDSGLGERELQDAIVEYTNLTPANAARVAKAIAKQYGLQQQIAETGAVIAEIAPEPEGAPRKSAVTKLIEQTTGVRKPVVKLQVSESAALKKQIQLKAREARETRKARKEAAEELAKSITDYVKANPIRGPINSRQAMSITKKALKLDVNNEAAVDRFEMYVERVIENANYDRDLADARALIKRAKAFAKSKDTQGNVKTTLEAIANISPTLLDNPFEFNLVVQRYLLGLAPVTAKQYAVMPDADVRRYLESLETQIKDNQEVLDRAKAQRILDKQAAYAEEKGIPLDEAIAILNSEEFLQEKTIEKLEDLTKLLTAMAQESQKDVKAYDDSGATPKQKELISFMRKVNLDSLINEEKKRYIRFANNLLANGATFGMEQFQSIALGQEAAMKAAKDKRLSNKLAAWISPIGGDKAIDTARRIALRTQSEADTFKNIFGREAVGAFRNILGLNRLDVAQTDSNRAKEQIANEFGEYFKGLRKKYGDDATGFEAKGYAGIAGYLIQTDGNKTEAESIPYRRRLMEQNIVELRKSDKQADLAEADLKERALAQLTGATNAEILSQLKALNPASYEQLMWVKDVMLPKWRDFLKEHDENFRNQANNYNNPDHLTITYKFPEGQLLPSEMEDVYQQDMIGMRIKQAANSIKRKDHPNLPVSKAGTIANIDINFGYNQYNALVDQVDKAFVAPAWEQVVAFTKAPEFEQVMGGRANALFVKNLLRDIQTSRSRQSITDDEAQLIAGGVRLARKISTQAVLGGITQPLRQVPDQLAKLFFTTGRFDLITKNLLTTAQAAPLLNKFPIGRRGDAQAGTQYASQFSELARKVEASVTDRKWAKYRELMNKVGEFWMTPLRGSDVWAAKVSWMSYYEAELNKKGIKMESWEREAELVDTDQDRKEAAAYAEFAVDFYGGASDPTKMASLSKQTNNGWKEFAKLLFLPLNSFALQQKNSLISDLRDAYLRTGDRKASIAAIAGTLAGMAAFHGMRIYIIGGLLYPAGKALLMGIFGIDMDEPDEEEKQKQLEDNWRKFKASMYGNIVAGGLGEFVEKNAIDAINRTAYLWDANINPDSLLNDKGEIMSFRQYEKEVSPLYRFRSYGSSEYSFGLADVLTEQATHALAETQQLMTPEEMEKYTGNEQAYAAFATGVEWMYFFRLMDTDVKRIATDLKRQMDKGVEEREKELKRIREGR